MRRLHKNKFLTISMLIMIFSSWVLMDVAFATHAFNPWHTGQGFGGSTNPGSAPNGGPNPNQDPNNNPSCGGDPVYLHSGEFYYECTSLVVPGRGMDVVIKHHYRSGLNVNGHYGYGWRLNYYKRVRINQDGDAVVIDGKGRRDVFTNDGIGGYVAPDGFFQTLVSNSNGTWTLIKKHGDKEIFDMNGNLSILEDRNGNQITINYDPAGLFPVNGTGLFAVMVGQPIVVNMDYRIASIVDTRGEVINFNYTPSGRLSSIVDFNGRTVSFGYDSITNNLLTITKPATTQYPTGVTKTFAYNFDHNLTSITDERGQTYVTNRYDSSHRVYEQDYGTGTWYFNYSVANQTTVTDRKGFVTTYHFNSLGNVVQKEQFTNNVRSTSAHSDPASFITTYAYDSNMLKISETMSNGNGIKYVYDDTHLNVRSRGNLLEIRRKVDMALPDGPTDLITTIQYETTHNLPTLITDPRGYTTTLNYDLNGNLLTLTQPMVNGVNPVTTSQYNLFGQVIKMIDPNGNVTDYDYYDGTAGTSEGFLKEIIQDPASGPSGVNAIDATTTFTYDSFGNLDVVTDPNGNMTDYDFDELNWLRQVTTPLGFVTQYDHDENGNVTEIRRQNTVPSGTWQTTQFTYDILNNLLTVTDPLNRVTTFHYDDNENMDIATDAENNVTSYVYDERDLLFTVTDAKTSVTQYFYDLNGNTKYIIDGEGNQTEYEYDGYDRQKKMIYPDTSFSEYFYDANSNITQQLTPSTKPIDFVYDALNRMTNKNFPQNVSLNSIYTYDAGSRLLTANNAASNNSFSYDALNRLKTNIQQLATNNYQLSYDYDVGSRQTELIYPSGADVDYTYDANDRLDLIMVNNQTLADYDYDPLNRRTKRAYVSALAPMETIYSYTAANELNNLTNQIIGTPNVNISTHDYPVYGQVSNRKQHNITRGTQPSEQFDFTYNNIYELENVTLNTNPARNYQYDLVGNRIQSTETPNPAVSYTDNNLNQYLTVGATAYGYDGNGNLDDDGVRLFTFDEQNRLSQAIVNGVTTNYAYDALNRRVIKDVGGAVTRFVYDGDEVIAEYNPAVSTTVPEVEYFMGSGIDEPLLMSRNGNFYFYHQDGLGSVTELTDVSGNIVESYEYDVYGNVTIKDGVGTVLVSSLIENPYTFTSRRLDAESGLMHYRARAYDSTIGRFLQMDPIGFAGGDINLYGYVWNSPTNYSDPLGLWGVQFGDTNFGVGDPTFLFGEGAGSYFADTLAATADGFIPFADPFSGSYNNCDKNLGISKTLGGVSRDFALSALTAGLFNAGSKTVLYSGEGALKAAQAGKGAGKILSETVGGKALTKLGVPSQGLGKQVWKGASGIFSANAKGEVQIFLRNPSLKGIYNTVERPVLNFFNNTTSVFK